MSMVHELAEWVMRASFDDLTEASLEALKIRVLDSLGCAIGALEGEPILMLRSHLEDLGGIGHCYLIGGGTTAPDRAALYNGALVRYLDYNDSYLAKGETCHPSDNLSAVLAASEYSEIDGKEFLTALAVAYQVHARLSDVAPVRAKGFDHTTQGSYAAAAGVSRALGLEVAKCANALAISGTALNALRVTRTGSLSHWKGLAYPHTAFGATHATFMAMRGITGPPEVFEGNKGFMDSIAGRFEIDWSQEDLSRVTSTILKKYNAEIHSQSATEGLLAMKEAHGFEPTDIDTIEIEIFDVAFHIIGGGEEGGKKDVSTKEEADHSLPYIVSVALLDDQVLPEQYAPERIQRDDVQDLLKRVQVRPRDDLSARFPQEMPCHLTVRLNDGTVVERDQADYEGFLTRPMSWDTARAKFDRLTVGRLDPSLADDLAEFIHGLESQPAVGLSRLLAQVSPPR